MQGLKEEAQQRGVSEKVIKRALKGVRPVPKVIEKDRHQPEFKLTYEHY
jgi:membrane-bound lytic murein transglycosylase B